MFALSVFLSILDWLHTGLADMDIFREFRGGRQPGPNNEEKTLETPETCVFIILYYV